MTSYKLQATKQKRAITEEITGVRMLNKWLTVYKANGYTIKTVERVR